MNEKIIKKIEKLLNQTVENGCTEQEALAAATMAQKLIAKHHIDVRQIGSDEDEKVDTDKTDTSNRDWELTLAAIIANNMCCRVIKTISYGTDSRGRMKRKYTLTFIGKDTDRKAVTTLFDKLLEVCKENIKIQKRIYKEKYGHFRNVEISYARGFLSAIRQVMNEQCKALMLVIPSEVDDKVKELFPKVKAQKTKAQYLSKEAYDKGFSDGRETMGTKKLK